MSALAQPRAPATPYRWRSTALLAVHRKTIANQRASRTLDGPNGPNDGVLAGPAQGRTGRSPERWSGQHIEPNPLESTSLGVEALCALDPHSPTPIAVDDCGMVQDVMQMQCHGSCRLGAAPGSLTPHPQEARLTMKRPGRAIEAEDVNSWPPVPHARVFLIFLARIHRLPPHATGPQHRAVDAGPQGLARVGSSGFRVLCAQPGAIPSSSSPP
jgi:hypothetical protein